MALGAAVQGGSRPPGVPESARGETCSPGFPTGTSDPQAPGSRPERPERRPSESVSDGRELRAGASPARPERGSPHFAGRARPLEAADSASPPPPPSLFPTPAARPAPLVPDRAEQTSMPSTQRPCWTIGPQATPPQPGLRDARVEGRKEVSSPLIPVLQTPRGWLGWRGAGRGAGPSGRVGPLAALSILLGRRWIRRSDQQRRN